MPNKTYGQLCPIARSLDVLGERWTLLVVRELLLGPKRFKDLLAVLPAMGTNRLSERLASLTADGVVRKSALPMPVYELTEFGEQLRAPLIAIGLWGLKLPMDDRIEPSSARAELIALCLAGAASASASAGVQAIYEFRVGNEQLHFRVNDGRVLPRSGPSPVAADVSVACDLATFMLLALGGITAEQALLEHRAVILVGTAAQFASALRILGYLVI
ncbi:MAG: helix-turn-helix domain-containing protein [Pseudomonadota bacterium]